MRVVFRSFQFQCGDFGSSMDHSAKLMGWRSKMAIVIYLMARFTMVLQFGFNFAVLMRINEVPN